MCLELLLIYLILFFIKISELDRFDKISIYYFLIHYPKIISPNINNRNFNFSFLREILERLYNFLILPFKNNLYISNMSESIIYGSYLFEYFPEKTILLNNKLFWAEIFNNSNINHPKLILYKQHNKLININSIQTNKYYITKPINGTMGLNIEKIKGSQILDKIKNNFLVQDLLYDCYHKKTRIFRFITLYNGEGFYLVEYTSNNLKSQRIHGGKTRICRFLKCNNLTNIEHKKLNKMCNQLKILHKNKFRYVFSLGWDIMLHCKDNYNKLNYNLDSYCLEGNIIHTTWSFSENPNYSLIKNYKNKYANFMLENNFI